MRIRTFLGLGFSAITLAFMGKLVMADAPETSIRPKARPVQIEFVSPRPMPRPEGITFTSLRPMPRPECLIGTEVACPKE